MHDRWRCLAYALAIALAGCGGKVILDAPGTGGAGGAGGDDGNGGNDGAGGFGTTCAVPPNPATLSLCGGTSGVGTGAGPFECAVDYCDQMGNTFEALCTSDGCQCLVNGKQQCLCTHGVNDTGDFCGGAPHCCPWKALGE